MKNFKIVNRYGFYSRCISDKLKKTIEPFKRNVAEIFLLYKTFWMPPFYYPNCKGELLPLLEAGASWEVSAFASQIYLPSSSGSPCPVFFYFPNIPTSIFQCFLYSVPHCNLYQFQFHSTHIYSFFLIIPVSL